MANRMPAVENKQTLHQSQRIAGTKAPWFESTDQHGAVISTATLAGKRFLLCFFPKSNTPPCTSQACSLRDAAAEFAAKDVTVIGVSADNVLVQTSWADAHALPFSLLADVDLTIVKAYDVWGPKEIAGRWFDGIVRTSFLVDAEGVIERVFHRPHTKKHGAEVLAKI